jgi:hypothetical protein
VIPPSLSRLERERIAAAVKAQAGGATVRWRCIGMRLAYVVEGREHLVLTAGTRPVFTALCQQALEEVRRIQGGANVNECNSAA